METTVLSSSHQMASSEETLLRAWKGKPSPLCALQTAACSSRLLTPWSGCLFENTWRIVRYCKNERATTLSSSPLPNWIALMQASTSVSWWWLTMKQRKNSWNSMSSLKVSVLLLQKCLSNFIWFSSDALRKKSSLKKKKIQSIHVLSFYMKHFYSWWVFFLWHGLNFLFFYFLWTVVLFFS